MRPAECKKCKSTFINYEEDKRNVICPACHTEYCNKSDTERSLFIIQDDYIAGKISKDKFITIIYPIMLDYCKSLILGNFSFRLKNVGDLEFYSYQALHYFFIYYLKSDDFIVKISFSGLLFYKITQAFNEKASKSSAELTLDYTFIDDHKVEYEDKVKYSLEAIEEYEDKVYLYKYILKLIVDLKDCCNDKRENFLRLMAIHHYLKFGEKKADNLFKNYSKYGKIKYEETLELLHSELKRLHKENL